MGRKKTGTIGGGKQYQRRFKAKGALRGTVPYWSPKGYTFKSKTDANDKAQRMRENPQYGRARVTKEKDGYRVWFRGPVRGKKRK